jgi:hypothetical protein
VCDRSSRPLAPLAQLDRASGYEPGGRRFESCRARQTSLAVPVTWVTVHSEDTDNTFIPLNRHRATDSSFVLADPSEVRLDLPSRRCGVRPGPQAVVCFLRPADCRASRFGHPVSPCARQALPIPCSAFPQSCAHSEQDRFHGHDEPTALDACGGRNDLVVFERHRAPHRRSGFAVVNRPASARARRHPHRGLQAQFDPDRGSDDRGDRPALGHLLREFLPHGG